MLKLQLIHSLSGKFRNGYKGITSDGIDFYCTLPCNKEIHRFTSDFTNYKAFRVCRPYSSICYDSIDNCFWALSFDSKSNIYKLDCDLQEIDCLCLSFPCEITKELNGISCGTERCELIISTPEFLAKVNKNNGCVCVITDDIEPNKNYLCVEQCCSHLLYATCKKNKSSITLASCAGKPMHHYCLEKKCKPIDFVIRAIPDDCCCCLFYILATDACHCSHLLIYTISFCNLTPMLPNGSNLIESIALMETALAHILNAEGEKIQKILAISDCFDEIMEMNCSVNCTIKNITELEKVLLEKLKEANHH